MFSDLHFSYIHLYFYIWPSLGGGEEHHFVRHLRLPGRDAVQGRGVLCLLPVELHRDLQVSSDLPGSGCSAGRVFQQRLFPCQISVLHAGLHQHGLEAADVAQVQPVDPSVPAGGRS